MCECDSRLRNVNYYVLHVRMPPEHVPLVSMRNNAGAAAAFKVTVMASSPYGPGTNCIRWFFVVCNFIFLGLGSITAGIGVWGLVVGSEGDYDIITGSNTISAAAVLLTAGVITLIIASIGICGAWGMWRPVLITYAIAVIIIVILELVAAILAFVYRDDITDELESNMEAAIKDYRVFDDAEDYQSDTNNAVENVQDVFECCGLESSEDWFDLNEQAVTDNGNKPPAKCSCDLSNSKCKEFTVGSIKYNAWKDGCIELLEENLRKVMLVIGVVGIVFAVIETFLVVLAISLFCCIRSTQKS